MQVTMYTTSWCPWCDRAKALLERKGVTEITEIDIEREDGLRETMVELTGRKTVPQIFIGERHIGGFDDLAELDRDGRLADLLA